MEIKRTLILYISMVILNVSVLSAFTILAISFNHWWIILISYFFRYEITRGGKDNDR